MRAWIVRLFCLGLLSMTAACTSFWQLGSPSSPRDGVSSSLVDYLYPKGEKPPEPTGEIPQLTLPLRVGIAFVPAAYDSSAALSEATRTELLARVRQKFVDRDYIEHIEVVPDSYLRSSEGFSGLEQVARLYGVDVMALVSYDQVAVTEDNKASVLYWTIVGAYLIDGTENEVQTFVDTAVFDVASRKLLFRAPGTDRRQSSSTAIESMEAMRRNRESGFGAAMDNMSGNLVTALDDFEERLARDPTVAQVSWSEGSGGGGAVGSPALLALLLLGLRRSRSRAT